MELNDMYISVLGQCQVTSAESDYFSASLETSVAVAAWSKFAEVTTNQRLSGLMPHPISNFL